MSKVFRFIYEVISELRMVTWPNFIECFNYGLVVGLVVLISSLAFSVMDFGFGYVVQLLIS